MADERADINELVIDWYLGQLDEQTRSWFESRCSEDPGLRARCDRLQRAMEPLDHWSAPAPSGLADRVLKHVHNAHPEPVSSVSSSGGGGRGMLFSFRQALATAACLALLASVMVPGLSHLRDRSRRMACAQNLHTIHGGTEMYLFMSDGALPFAGVEPGMSWLPHGISDARFASNSRNVFLLMKLGLGPEGRHFVCPADEVGVPLVARDVGVYDDFESGRNLSYATMNMMGTTPRGSAVSATPYMSDTNPLFDGGYFRVGPAARSDHVNSPIHGGRGQNVLALNGSVAWLTTPVFGPQRDNIWVVDDGRNIYTGVEAQHDQDDAFLVPGFPNGQSVERLNNP